MSAGFIDEVDVHVQGGRGGDGCVAFRREKFVPLGGPSGGDGGDGGSVIFVASRRVNTLSPLRHRGLYRAKPGAHGEGSNRHGRTGEDLVVIVPLGTVIFEAEPPRLLGDLDTDGQTMVAAAGGRGGRGNARFASATHRAPRRCEPGRSGDDRWLRLELKLLADVGLVGLPNAGKSTLVSRISAARPKIAAYPFTTLVPHLGVVDWTPELSYVVADIPGLIEGSHLGQGLGDQFLRHVERTSVLLHLVDSSDMADPVREGVAVIESELLAFDATLLDRPRLLVATKTDAATSRDRVHELESLARERDLPFLAISAATGEGLAELVRTAGEMVERERAAGPRKPDHRAPARRDEEE